MAVLRSIESKIESLFEGVFGRAFRTHVQPIELARKLAKEMDDHRNVSVSRVYVPNEYTVYLSSDDREAVRRVRGGSRRRAPGVPRRARAARALRAPRHAAGARDDRRRPRGRASSASRPGSSPPRAAPSSAVPAELPVDAPGADDDLQGARSRHAGRAPGRAEAGGRHAHRRRPQARGDEAKHRARPLARGGRTPRGRQRVPPPCRAAPGGSRVLDRRPRLDERPRGQRQARRAGAPRGTETRSRSARPRSCSDARCRS